MRKDIRLSEIQTLTKASSLTKDRSRLSSGIAVLDTALGGGLVKGELSEWGLVPGKNGLQVIIQFLKARPLCLWVYQQADYSVYPPSWHSQGLDLEQIYFVRCHKPFQELRPIFLEPLFDLIIFDRLPFFKPEDYAFLASKARVLQAHILIITPFLLKNTLGSAHIRLRVNAYCDFFRRYFCVHRVKGLQQEKLTFSLPGLL